MVTTRAELLLLANRAAAAKAELDGALPMMEKTASPALPLALGVRGRMANGERAWTDAVTYAERSIAGMEKSVGVTGPDLVRPLYELAVAKVGLKQPAAAVPPLERAIAIATAAQMPAKDLAPLRALLDQVK